ncbi:hypothetical protein [Streptomyces sp. NPDC050428]|uniref:hypothetical protein n=1 Tax=Streptomyces sp. NPDC050428 TaxID=3155757 RepID=UPI00342B0213
MWTDSARAKQLAGIYNETFNTLVMTEHDTAPLTLPGICDWTMLPHQNAAIRRILSEPTALLAHVVGAGKTASMVGASMELRRTGMASKPVLVVPNHMLKQFSRDFLRLYPLANLLALSRSDLGVTKRAKFLGRMAGSNWDAVILTHDAFIEMPLRPATIQHYMDTEIGSLREQIVAASEAGMEDRTIKQIEKSLANAEARLAQQLHAAADYGGVTFEDTGADYVFLDEAHEFKNLRTISAIPGAGIAGSGKATKLHMVEDHLREHTSSGRVATHATGTPIANSVTEAYVLMRYLAPDVLERLGLTSFDNWAATYGEIVSALEPDPKGGGYRYKARFARFFNVPELMAIYRVFADVQMAEDLNLPTPDVRGESEGQRGETVIIPATGAQRDFIKALKSQPWINKPGGVLKALGEGLRASLDMRLVGGLEEQGSKLSYAADRVAEIWRETKDVIYPVSKDDPTPQKTPGALQLVFLDEGTPGGDAKHQMDLYTDLRDKLVDQGIPREQIRFIHEASTDKQKDALFADCRSGKVTVLVGSTQKMGTGTNVQDRAVALHHLSYPWRPADMSQRDGRIERQGNLNMPGIAGTPDDVRILYYVTERTFDEFRLNTLARKAKFISQIQRRNFTEREIEDVGAEAMNLGMLTALASGDPAVLQHAEAAAERVRLASLARDWDRAQDSRTTQIGAVESFIARAEPALAAMREALPHRKPTTGDAFTMRIGGTDYSKKEDASAALGARMTELARNLSLRPRVPIPVGTLGGFDFHAEVSFDHKGSRQLKLRFGWGHVVPDGHRDDRAQWLTARITEDNGRGAVQSLENFLSRLGGDISSLEKELARQLTKREEITGHLQKGNRNPYRELSRSKQREEHVLGRLIIANEKASELAERFEAGGGNADEEQQAKLVALRTEIDDLQHLISVEHDTQEALRKSTRRKPDDTGTAGDDSGSPSSVIDGNSTTAATDAAGASDQEAAPEPPSVQEVLPIADKSSAQPEASERLDESSYRPDGEPTLAQMIDHDIAALASQGWTEVVRPYGSQEEAKAEQEQVTAAYELWAASETALPMLTDIDGDLTGEEVGITNPAGYIASWHHRSRVAATTAGPTGGRMVVEQFEGLAHAARRADSHLAEDAYPDPDDRELLLDLAGHADRYAKRLAATLDLLEQQRAQVDPADARMKEVRALESAMEYLVNQGPDFRMDRRGQTYSDRAIASARIRDDMLQIMGEFTELPPEKLNLTPDSRMQYALIRGIHLYVGWVDPGTPQAKAVLGFDQLPLLSPEILTAAELEALSATELIDRLDSKLAPDALEMIRDREQALIGDLLAREVQGENSIEPSVEQQPQAEIATPSEADTPTLMEAPAVPRSGVEDTAGPSVPDAADPSGPPARSSGDEAPVRLSDRQLWDEALLAITEAAAADSDMITWAQDAVDSDQFRDGFAEWAQRWALETADLSEERLPTWLRAYLDFESESPATRRTLFTEAAKVVWRQANGNFEVESAPVAAADSAETAAAVPGETEAADTEPTGAVAPAPEMVNTAAILRYYEPLFQRHGLSGAAAVADYITRPGYGYEYDADSPLIELVARIGASADQLGGAHQTAVDEWVTYNVGLPRLEASLQLSDVAISLANLMTGIGRTTGSVDLKAILAAPPGTVIDLPPLPERTASQPVPDPAASPYTDAATEDAQTPPDAEPVPVLDTADETPASSAPPAGDDATPMLLSDPQLWDQGLSTLVGAATNFEKLTQGALANDGDGFRILFAEWAENWMVDQHTGPTAGWPRWARAYFSSGDEAHEARERLLAEAATTTYQQLRAPADDPPQTQSEREVTPSRTGDTPADTPSISETAGDFGDRIMIGHIGSPQKAPPDHSAGWAIMALLSETQMKDLVSAMVVDGQPPTEVPGYSPTERVREWITGQQQAPTTAFYASTSSELPSALRGAGDVQLSTRANGLTIEQGKESTTILWEELPAWIDAAVTYDTDNGLDRSSLRKPGRQRLDRAIHFDRERTGAFAENLAALSHALRKTPAPSDDQLADSRDRHGPSAPTTSINEPEITAEQRQQDTTEPLQLPDEAIPIPAHKGYHYVRAGRTVRLYTTAGEHVAAAKWSLRTYRYEGDVQGDTVRGTDDARTTAGRMANHHAAVYGNNVYRPALDEQSRDPVWILHNDHDTLVFGVGALDNTIRAALWTGGGFTDSRKAGGWYLPRTWHEPTRRQRVDTALRVLAAAGRTIEVYAARQDRQAPTQPARLPVLAVTPPDVNEIPALFNAERYTTDVDMRADTERLDTAYERWNKLPTVRAYNDQDRAARPDGFGKPDNPIAELHVAYGKATTALHGSALGGGPEEILRKIYAVAAWCTALEPAVEEELLDPLQQLYEAAHFLAARSQATYEAYVHEASQSAASQSAGEPALGFSSSQTQDAPPEPPAPPSHAQSTDDASPGSAARKTTEEAPATVADDSAPQPDVSGDPFGTLDLYDEFGLKLPPRAPAAPPLDDPDPEISELVGVGQMTVEDAEATDSETPQEATTPDLAIEASPETAADKSAPEPGDPDTEDDSTAGQSGPDQTTAQPEDAGDPPEFPEPLPSKIKTSALTESQLIRERLKLDDYRRRWHEAEPPEAPRTKKGRDRYSRRANTLSHRYQDIAGEFDARRTQRRLYAEGRPAGPGEVLFGELIAGDRILVEVHGVEEPVSCTVRSRSSSGYSVVGLDTTVDYQYKNRYEPVRRADATQIDDLRDGNNWRQGWEEEYGLLARWLKRRPQAAEGREGVHARATRLRDIITSHPGFSGELPPLPALTTDEQLGLFGAEAAAPSIKPSAGVPARQLTEPPPGQVSVDGAPRETSTPEPDGTGAAPEADPPEKTTEETGSRTAAGAADVQSGGNEPSHQQTASARQFDAQAVVYHDGRKFTVRSMSEDGLTVHTFAGEALPAHEVTAEKDMPPVVSRHLADGWWEFTHEGRTYTAAKLPAELTQGRLATLSTVIVDEDGELVGRAFGFPTTPYIIWAHLHPGVDHPHIVGWLSVGGHSTSPDYSEEERAFMRAGPPADVMFGDADEEQLGLFDVTSDTAFSPQEPERRQSMAGSSSEAAPLQQSVTPDRQRETPGEDADTTPEPSRYAINAYHPMKEERLAGTVDGRRIPTAREMERYETDTKAMSEEGERALFGSPEGMRALAAEGFVPTPVMPSDSGGQVWRNGRLIGRLFEPRRYAYQGMDQPEIWWSEQPLASEITRFTTEEAAIAHLVLRDKERGDPDLSIVHPDLAWSFEHTDPGLAFPGPDLRGLESLKDSPKDMERYRAVTSLVAVLGRGESLSGNVADDLAHLHDELRWLDSTHYQQQEPNLRDRHILGPGWLAAQIRRYLDVLRPEDPRAMHHEARKNRAAWQFLEEVLANGGRESAEPVKSGDIRAGDIVHLSGRLADKYPGAEGVFTGYVIDEPRAAALTVDGKRIKAWRINVGPDLRSYTDTFVIPVTDGGLRLVRAKNVSLPLDDHVYGRPVALGQTENTAPPEAIGESPTASPPEPNVTTNPAPFTAHRAGESTSHDAAANDPVSGASPAGDKVVTPDVPGEVMAVNADSVLIRGDQGTRVFALNSVKRPDGSPFGADPGTEKARQNAEALAQAATHEGVTLLHSDRRLRDLDVNAGHGTIVDAEGTVIGWVRARFGDDGRRYWWGQDADGGEPADMQWHEEMPAKAGVPAIRVADLVRDGHDDLRTSLAAAQGRADGQVQRTYTTPDRAIREMTLTEAQVRELGKLSLSGTYRDGTPITTLPWDPRHRRYSPYAAQAGALAAAAREAAAQQDGTTPESRRNKKVLLSAASKLEFHQYDSARSAATIPPPDEPDLYAGPYEPRAEESDSEAPSPTGTQIPTAKPEQATPDTGRDAAELDSSSAGRSEVLGPAEVQVGDYVRAQTQNPAGRSVVGEGYLLADAKEVTATRDGQRVKAWRLHLGREGATPSVHNGVTVLLGERVERLPAPQPVPAAEAVEHTNTLGWKGPQESREKVGEHEGKPVEIGELHVTGSEANRVVYLGGQRIGRLIDARGMWNAHHDEHGYVGNGMFSSHENAWETGHYEPADATRDAALAITRSHKTGEGADKIHSVPGPTVPQHQAERILASHLDPRTSHRLKLSDSERGRIGVYVDDTWAGQIHGKRDHWQLADQGGQPYGTAFPTPKAAGQAVMIASGLLDVRRSPYFHFPQHAWTQLVDGALDNWINASEQWLHEDAPNLPKWAHTPAWVRQNLDKLKEHREQREATRAREVEELGGADRIKYLTGRAELEAQVSGAHESYKATVDGRDIGTIERFGAQWNASVSSGRHQWHDENHALAALVARVAVDDSGSAPPGVPQLSFPDDRSPSEGPRRWIGVWAEPRLDGMRNVFLDRVLAARGGKLPDGWSETRFWITAAFEVDPTAQYDENTRHGLEQVPPNARLFLTGQANELRSLVQQVGDDLRVDIRTVLMDNIATRAGRERSAAQVTQMYDEATQKARTAVRAQIEHIRAGAAEHGLSERQAEDFLVSVAGGDDPDQVSYGVRGEFSEAVRPLQAALLDGYAYRAAFAGWATQDDSSNWAGIHHANTRLAAMNARMIPVADPRTATGELKIGEAELPKGMRWARASELLQGDIFHHIRHPRHGTTDAFDGMQPPQYVIHTHRDGLEGALRTVTLDSHNGNFDPKPDDHVVIVENPEPAVRKRASHRARTDVATSWYLPEDEEAYAVQSRLPSQPEGENVPPETLSEGDLVRVRGTERHGGIGQFEGYLFEPPERTTFWHQGREIDGWKLHLATRRQLQIRWPTGSKYYIAADGGDTWVEPIGEHMTRSFRDGLLGSAPLPAVGVGQEEGANTRHTALVHHLQHLGEGRTVSGDIARDLALARDELLWLRDTYQPDDTARNAINNRVDAVAEALDALNTHVEQPEQTPSKVGPPPTGLEPEVRQSTDSSSGPAEQISAPDSPVRGGGTGVYGYGRAEPGECERCGEESTDRYVVMWTEDALESDDDLAVECAPCATITTGLSADQFGMLSDLADTRRGGRLPLPARVAGLDVVQIRTAPDEWTSVHLPTGQRYRTVHEDRDDLHRGFVTRDLGGVSYGSGSSALDGYRLAERAALGRTAESHPTSSDYAVEAGFLQSLRAAVPRADEYITSAVRGTVRDTYVTGPLWDMIIGDRGFTVEMVYLQGVKGDDGHRLYVTGPDDTTQTFCESWDEVIAWARNLAHTTPTEVRRDPALVQEQDSARFAALRERALAAPPAPARQSSAPESDEQVSERLGGLGEFSELATFTPPEDPARIPVWMNYPEGSDRTPVWMDGEFIGEVSDLNKGSQSLAPVWQANPPLRHENRVTRFETQEGAVAHLVVQALKAAGPVDPSRVDGHMTQSFRSNLLGSAPLPGVPAAGQEEGADARHAALVHHLQDLGEGRTISGDIARDLGVAHDELLWLRDTYQPKDAAWDAINNRIETAARALDALRPDSPHSRQTPTEERPVPTGPEEFADDAPAQSPPAPAPAPAQPTPSEPAADAAEPITPDPKKGSVMTTTTERVNHPDLVLETDPRFVLRTAGPAGGPVDRWSLLRGADSDAVAATFTPPGVRSAGWRATVGRTQTPPAASVERACDDALMVLAFEAGETGPTPPFREEGDLSRPDLIRAAVEGYVDATLVRVRDAAWDVPVDTPGAADFKEFARADLFAHVMALSDNRESPAMKPGEALQFADELSALKKGFIQWRSALADAARPAMDFALVQAASEATHLEARIRATVAEVRSERSREQAAGQSREVPAAMASEPPVAPRAPEHHPVREPFASQPPAPAPDSVTPTQKPQTPAAPAERSQPPKPTPWPGKGRGQPAPAQQTSTPPQVPADAAKPVPPTPKPETPAAPAESVPIRGKFKGQPVHIQLWPGDGLPPGKLERRGDVMHAPDGNALWRVRPAPASASDAPEAPGGDKYKTFWQAWEDRVGREGGDPEGDAAAAVRSDMRILDRTLADASARWDSVAPAPPAPSEAPSVRDDPSDDGNSRLDSAAPPPPAPAQEAADGVNNALVAADTHSDALNAFPEWQKIQTIRGAFRHLWDTIKKRAGAHWPALSSDSRFKDFWKKLSIWVCEGISRQATRLANHLRGGIAPLPTAEAILDLGDAAITYSEKAQPQSVDDLPDKARERLREHNQTIRRSLRTGKGLPYSSQADAVHATRDLAEAFRDWMDTPMGRELRQSDHPRVAHFRKAWQKLPPNDLPTGPGPAAGPYGEVAVSARSVADAAVKSGRFSPDDVAALYLVAGNADTHSARLARTLPLAARGQQVRQARQAVVPRPRVAQPPAPAAAAPRSRVSA